MESSSPSSKRPPPACAHQRSVSSVPSNRTSSSTAEYVFHGPPSTRYCVMTVPEPASASCGSSVTRTGPFVPAIGVSVAPVTGASESTRRRSDFAVSVLGTLAPSVEKYSTTCSPGSEISNGSSYLTTGPPSIRYSVLAIRPVAPSNASSATVGTDAYQPSSPSGFSGVTVAVVVGGTRSEQSTRKWSNATVFAGPAPSDDLSPTLIVSGLPRFVMSPAIFCQLSPSNEPSTM